MTHMTETMSASFKMLKLVTVVGQWLRARLPAIKAKFCVNIPKKIKSNKDDTHYESDAQPASKY